ncbi:MAG: imidazole glycerol phosphate synthase subunit HisH [Thermoleophilaceae bacterium]|nr:imidazole glycerol phosphate synthase subunit HisH [Thermoleophilaceae bacterium]
MILVIDYGVGNVGSIRKMLLKGGIEDVLISGSQEDLERAEKLVLPGVGSFDDAMSRLRASGLVPALERRVLEDGVPVLGICLGMHMLGRSSEEGVLPGLGWIDAETVRLEAPEGFRVPHIGWNAVSASNGSPLFAEITPEDRFYFLHSYEIRCDDSAEVSAESEYGRRFTCAVRRGNLHGVQFHPEKSHGAGRRLLSSFARET